MLKNNHTRVLVSIFSQNDLPQSPLATLFRVPVSNGQLWLSHITCQMHRISQGKRCIEYSAFLGLADNHSAKMLLLPPPYSVQMNISSAGDVSCLLQPRDDHAPEPHISPPTCRLFQSGPYKPDNLTVDYPRPLVVRSDPWYFVSPHGVLL